MQQARDSRSPSFQDGWAGLGIRVDMLRSLWGGDLRILSTPEPSTVWTVTGPRGVLLGDGASFVEAIDNAMAGLPRVFPMGTKTKGDGWYAVTTTDGRTVAEYRRHEEARTSARRFNKRAELILRPPATPATNEEKRGVSHA